MQVQDVRLILRIEEKIPSNQIGTDPTHTFAYDLAGNLLSDGLNGYAYDAANRLVRYTDGGTS